MRIILMIGAMTVAVQLWAQIPQDSTRVRIGYGGGSEKTLAGAVDRARAVSRTSTACASAHTWPYVHAHWKTCSTSVCWNSAGRAGGAKT